MKKMFRTHSKNYAARNLTEALLHEIDGGYITYEDAIRFRPFFISDPVLLIKIAKRLKRIMEKRGVYIYEKKMDS